MDLEEAHDILGVDIDASDEDIEKKYQELIKKNHPDQGGSARLFKQIQTAYKNSAVNNTEHTSNSDNQTSEHSDDGNFRRETDSKNSGQVYDLKTVSDIEIEHLIDNAVGELITKNRLTKKKPGISHPQTLTDSPLIEYIFQQEQPHFSLVLMELTMNGEELTPKNGAFLIITDICIRIVIGFNEGDEVYNIPYESVQEVNFKPASVATHKFEIGTKETQINCKLGHASSNESQVTPHYGLEDEYRNAESFIREAVYATLD